MYVHACMEFSVCHNAWGDIHPSEEHGAVAGVGSGCVVVAVYKEGFVEGESRTRMGWGKRMGENGMGKEDGGEWDGERGRGRII